MHEGPQYPDLIPAAFLLRRQPLLPVLNRLRPNIYGVGATEELAQKKGEGLFHLENLVDDYCKTGVPFVVINMGIPKSGKTILSGEQLAFASGKLHDHFIRVGRRWDLRGALTYIPYESVQVAVERAGEVPLGHGPGKQTPEDHRVSSGRMEEEILRSLASWQNVIAEGPFFAGRGELGLIEDITNHRGKFEGINYNVRIMWPIPDSLHAIHTMMTRVDFERRERTQALKNRNVRIHAPKSDPIHVSGANERTLHANFYPALQRHVRQLYSGFLEIGLPKSKYDFLLHGEDLSIFTIHDFFRDVAPTLFSVLGIQPEVSVVGTNSILPPWVKVEYYEAMLRYFDKFASLVSY